MSKDDDTYTFVVEWFDAVADLTRKYNLTYWPKDSSLSMFDLTKNRLFLKRVVNKDIVFPNHLYIGKTIVVYSRQLKVVDYADTFTKTKFAAISEAYSVLFIGLNSFTTFLTEMNQYKAPLHFKSIKSVKPNAHIQRNLKIQREKEIFIFCQFVGSKDIKSALLACDKKQDFCGIICDESNDSHLIQEINECEPSAITNKNTISSLCLIKPHSLLSTPSIINDILKEGFTISAITTKKLTLSEAKDFYEVYQGVVKEYNYMIEQLLSGSSIILQIHCGSMTDAEKENSNGAINTNKTFVEFREFAGPKDPEIAKYIRPHTLRAKYGVDRVQNAVHCTDLQEDGALENEFFFNIIS